MVSRVIAGHQPLRRLKLPACTKAIKATVSNLRAFDVQVHACWQPARTWNQAPTTEGAFTYCWKPGKPQALTWAARADLLTVRNTAVKDSYEVALRDRHTQTGVLVELNYHPDGTQVFMPTRPCLMVLAPTADQLNWNTVGVFYVDPRETPVLELHGTWHHTPLPLTHKRIQKVKTSQPSSHLCVTAEAPWPYFQFVYPWE